VSSVKVPHEERLRRLGLWSLEERRNRADLLELYKMIKGFSAVSWSQFFTRSDASVTRGHNWKLQKRHNQSDIRLHFFFQCCINRWNSLSQYAVDAPSVHSFSLNIIWTRSDFNSWASLWTDGPSSPMAARNVSMYFKTRYKIARCGRTRWVTWWVTLCLRKKTCDYIFYSSLTWITSQVSDFNKFRHMH